MQALPDGTLHSHQQHTRKHTQPHSEARRGLRGARAACSERACRRLALRGGAGRRRGSRRRGRRALAARGALEPCAAAAKPRQPTISRCSTGTRSAWTSRGACLAPPCRCSSALLKSSVTSSRTRRCATRRSCGCSGHCSAGPSRSRAWTRPRPPAPRAPPPTTPPTTRCVAADAPRPSLSGRYNETAALCTYILRAIFNLFPILNLH